MDKRSQLRRVENLRIKKRKKKKLQEQRNHVGFRLRQNRNSWKNVGRSDGSVTVTRTSGRRNAQQCEEGQCFREILRKENKKPLRLVVLLHQAFCTSISSWFRFIDVGVASSLPRLKSRKKRSLTDIFSHGFHL